MKNVISLAQAVTMTTLFRAEKEKVINPEFAGKNILPNSETFDRAAFDAVLAQPGCVGLRVYYGMKEDLILSAIIVGVNEKDQDMLPTEETENIIIEEGVKCPPICPTPPDGSPLNP